MKDKPDLHEFDGFRSAWISLEEEGIVDAWLSVECYRVWDEYVQAGMPKAAIVFISLRANVVPEHWSNEERKPQ